MTSARSRTPVQRITGEPAFVLHRYDWSESSLILDVFTRHHGRVALVAKGAKRPYSQLRSVLLPFQRLAVAFSVREEEGGEVHTLKAAEWAGGAAMLTGAALLTGFYLNELLMKLLARADPHPRLFDAYAATLPSLRGPEREVQRALRAFELLLLRELGVLPELDVVTLTQASVSDETVYRVHGDAGVMEAPAGEPGVPGRVLRSLERALQAWPVTGGPADVQQACEAALPELKAALRPLLHYHLGTSVLRTRQLLIELLPP